jgi:hypothetical protein
VLRRDLFAKWCLLPVLTIMTTPFIKSQDKKPITVFLSSDCVDTVGSNAASALREKIRGSNGYLLASGPTKGRSGYEIVLTCAAIPGHEAAASAVSYIFDVVLPDEARYFVQPGIGIVGTDGVNGWSQNVFSQFDNWISTTQRAMSH